MSVKERGFASMDPKKREAISRKGGEARKKSIGAEGYSKMGKSGGRQKSKKSK
jgi:general stress protein YciG